MAEEKYNTVDRMNTQEWVESLAGKLLPIPKPEEETSALIKLEPDWRDDMPLDLNKSEDVEFESKRLRHASRELSAETIEPYMFPLKDMTERQPKYDEGKPKPIPMKSDIMPTDSIFKLKTLKDPRATCDKVTLVCECTPVSQDDWDTTPPLFEPCVCYKDQLGRLKPTESELSVPDVCVTAREHIKTSKFIVDELPDYSVTSYGRGLIPSRSPDSLPDDPSTIVHSFLLTGEDGFQVEVSQLGARVVAIRAPNDKGHVEDVILGFDRPKGYLDNADLHWGGVVGRLADRVRGPKPQLHLPGNGYTLLSENEDRNHYMGGNIGFDQEVWEVYVRPSGVLFTLLNRKGTEGYPGDVVASVAYSVLPVNRLVVKMDALASAPTPLALALPLAFNLAGHGEGEEALREHVLNVDADKYYTTSKKPGFTRYTGKKNIGGSIYDLRIPRQLGKLLKYMPENTYDMLVIPSEHKPKDKSRRVAKLMHPKSRRVMEVWSDLPALRISTNLGLPEAARRLPDPHDLVEVRGILDELLEDVTFSTWDIFQWLRDADGSGDRANIYNPPPKIETPPSEKKWSLSTQKPGSRWRQFPKPSGGGDQWPSRPGLTALPPALRGPAKLPFRPSTMQILREGGVTTHVENPTGRVVPKRTPTAAQRMSDPNRESFNLKSSLVGSMKSSLALKRVSIDSSVLTPSLTSSITQQKASPDTSLPDEIPLNLNGSVSQAQKPPSFRTIEKIKPAIQRPLPPTHRPSVWGKAYPSAWGTERLRLRGGADLSKQSPPYQWNDPNVQQYDPKQYDQQQYHPQENQKQQNTRQRATPKQSEAIDPNTDQWPQMQYHDMWPQAQHSDQWHGSQDDIARLPASSKDITALIFKSIDPSKGIRASGLGSIAMGFAKRGQRPEMIKGFRPSGLGSIMTADPSHKEKEHVIDVDPESLLPLEAPPEPAPPRSPITMPGVELDAADIFLRGKLLELMRPPNKGFEFRMPMRAQREDATHLIDDILGSILDKVHTPREFRGFNSVEYTNNGAVLLQPQLEPLFGDKSNISELLLRPGKHYSHTVEYIFKIREKKRQSKKHTPMDATKTETTKEEGMIDHCSAEVSLKSESSKSFQKLHDSCSEKSSISLPSI